MEKNNYYDYSINFHEDSLYRLSIKEISNVVGINFLDHVIIGDGYYSYSKEGRL